MPRLKWRAIERVAGGAHTHTHNPKFAEGCLRTHDIRGNICVAVPTESTNCCTLF